MIARLRNALGLAKSATPVALRFDRPLVCCRATIGGVPACATARDGTSSGQRG